MKTKFTILTLVLILCIGLSSVVGFTAVQTPSQEINDLLVVTRRRHDLGEFFDYIDAREDYLGRMAEGMSGNMNFSLPSDITLESLPQTGSTTIVDPVEVVSSNDNSVVMDWFNASLSLTKNMGSATGSITLSANPITLSHGTAVLTITYDDSNMQNGDSYTIDIDSQSILGYSLSSTSITINMPSS